MSDKFGSEPKLTISKLDAARRQLQTAIALWFEDGDAVSIHTLACAAYEIIHAVSKKRNPGREPLIFDNDVIHENSRAEFNRIVKSFGNFFKHANNDGDGVIQFTPALARFFIGFAIKGLDACGERLGPEESAFMSWNTLHGTDVTEEGRKLFECRNPAENLRYLRTLNKQQFLADHRSGRIQFRLRSD